MTDIRYTGYKTYDGKKEIQGIPSSYVNNDNEAQTLEIYAEDSVTGAEIGLYYTVFPIIFLYFCLHAESVLCPTD